MLWQGPSAHQPLKPGPKSRGRALVAGSSSVTSLLPAFLLVIIFFRVWYGPLCRHRQGLVLLLPWRLPLERLLTPRSLLQPSSRLLLLLLVLRVTLLLCC